MRIGKKVAYFWHNFSLFFCSFFSEILVQNLQGKKIVIYKFFISVKNQR